MTYQEWAAKHPAAAADMAQMIGATEWIADSKTAGKSESWSQKTARINIANQGAYSWRNNVGAMPSKCQCGAKLCCPACGKGLGHHRWGLANDSPQLNKKFKSSDLILAIPRLITSNMVGTVIAQFGAVETKRPGWRYMKTEREMGQANWLALVQKIGGYATFTTGEIKL